MTGEQQLIGSIYDAAINSALWPEVVAGIASHCGGEKVMLATTDILHPCSNFQFTHNIPEEHIAGWREGYDEEEVELHNRWLASADIDTPVCSDDYFGGPEGFRQAGGSFVEMLERYGIRRQLVVSLDRDSFRLSGVGLNNFDPFPPYAATTLKMLAPHLRRALAIRRQLAVLELDNHKIYSLLEGLAAGVILLDSNYRVRYTTTTARRLVVENGSLVIRQGQLRPLNADYTGRLQALISSAVSTAQRDFCDNAGGVLGLPSETGRALTLSVMPLSVMAAYQELQHENIAAAIFVSATGEQVDLPGQALADLYKLTSRELQLCLAFVNEVELDKAADRLGLKVSSVRSLLKGIYQKTGQRSQAGLMRLLMESRLNFRHL